MSNIFVNLPVPAANGSGASVDVTAMGATKTIIVGGSFIATVTIEYSPAPAGNFWAPVPSGSFVNGPGRVVVELAAQRMRAVTSGYKSGAPNADVGAPYAPGSFLQLTGVAASIATMPPFKTVFVDGPCNVEISEDNVSFSQVFSFQAFGAQSGAVVGQFARVTNGVTCWMGAAAPGIDAEPSSGALAIQVAGLLDPDPPNVNIISQSGQISTAIYNGVGLYDVALFPIPGITTALQAIPTAASPDVGARIVNAEGDFDIDHVLIHIRVFDAAGLAADAAVNLHVDLIAP